MNRDNYIALLLVILVLLFAAWGTYTYAEPAGCTTDLECSELCAPDDMECDGGPQS